jgi:hypothetical protein
MVKKCSVCGDNATERITVQGYDWCAGDYLCLMCWMWALSVDYITQR